MYFVRLIWIYVWEMVLSRISEALNFVWRFDGFENWQMSQKVLKRNIGACIHQERRGGGGEMTCEASKWYLMSLTMPAILFLVLFWTSSAKWTGPLCSRLHSKIHTNRLKFEVGIIVWNITVMPNSPQRRKNPNRWGNSLESWEPLLVTMD